jgi:hypothetical protein
LKTKKNDYIFTYTCMCFKFPTFLSIISFVWVGMMVESNFRIKSMWFKYNTLKIYLQFYVSIFQIFRLDNSFMSSKLSFPFQSDDKHFPTFCVRANVSVVDISSCKKLRSRWRIFCWLLELQVYTNTGVYSKKPTHSILLLLLA